VQGDYLSGVADRLGVPLEKLLLDNLDAVKDLDKPLAGTRLAVCPRQVPRTARATARAPDAPAAAPTKPVAPPGSSSQAAQLRALLAFKAAVDKQGTLDWTAEGGANAGYCNFYGVGCDAQSNIAIIGIIEENLGGTLPPGSVLAPLTALISIHLGNTGVSGTLPANWGALNQLEDIRICGSPGITGKIPQGWKMLTQLRFLYLR
jgi:hypothetical protein